MKTKFKVFQLILLTLFLNILCYNNFAADINNTNDPFYKQVLTAANPNIDVEHYSIEIDLREFTFCDFTQKLPISITLRIRARKEIQSVYLHFNTQAVLNLAITNNESNIVLPFMAYSYLNNPHYKYIEIPLSEILKKDHWIELHFQYQYDLNQVQSLPFGGYYSSVLMCQWSSRHKQFYLNPYAYGFRSIFPSNDSLEDAATVEYKILVPKDFIVAANGYLVATNSNSAQLITGAPLPEGGLLFHWKMNQPISTSVMSFIVTESPPGNVFIFDPIVVKGAKIPFFYFAPNADYSYEIVKQQLNWVHKVTQFMEDHIAPYPFADAKIAFTQGQGGMEYASIVHSRPHNALHEHLHNWWGNTVRPKHFGDGWISEGFTTYFETVVEDQKEQYDHLNPSVKNNANCYKLNGNPSSVNLIYDAGAICLHSLRLLIAEVSGLDFFSIQEKEVFFNFYRDYFSKFQFQALDSKDFVNFVKESVPLLLAKSNLFYDERKWVDRLSEWEKCWFEW